MTFYEKYLLLCQQRGKSPSAVANAIGLNNSSVTYWKRGSMPKSETVVKLADYFGIPSDYLIDEEMNDPFPNEAFHIKASRLSMLEISTAYKVDEVQIDEVGRVKVLYALSQRGITADEFQKLLSFTVRLSEEYHIALSEIIDIMQIATNTVAKTAMIMQMMQSAPFQKGSAERETGGFPPQKDTEEG